MAPKQKVRRRYLFPCEGYISAVRKSVAPATKITTDSRDFLVSPTEGQLNSRKGTALIGDTVGPLQQGLLESKWGARCRQMFEVVSDSITNGFPGIGGLFSSEDAVNRYGQIFVRANAANYTLGEEFSTTHYPLNPSAPGPNFKWIPLPYLIKGAGGTLATGLTRAAHERARRFSAPGARRVVETQEHLFSPNLFGAPMKWDRRFNTSPSSGSEVLRARFWGHQPPLWPPTQGATVASTGNDANWEDGDTFYASVIFQMEDGPFSMPFINRPPSTTVTAAKGGLFVIGTPGGVATYRSVQWDDIPIGPPGTRARILCRTVKIKRSASTSPIDLDPSALLVTAIIRNNTSTSYIDALGNDLNLRQDPNVVRFDHLWPPSARYAFEFDGRIGVGYTRLNPCALIVAPSGAAATRDKNGSDVSTGHYPGGTGPHYLVRVHVTAAGARTLGLRKIAATLPGAPTDQSITLNSLTSLQSVIDTINATLHSGTADEWACQPVPGVDPNITSDQLAPTSIEATGAVLSGTTITGGAGAFAEVAVGMKVVFVSGTGSIPANTYVTAKASDTVITVSNTLGAGTATIHLGNDTGDDGVVNDNTIGNVRTFGLNMPEILAFRGSFIDSFTTDKRSIFYTTGAPFGAQFAAQSFVNSIANRRGGPPGAGLFMGGAPLSRGAVVCYSKAIYTLENRKGGTTGEDQDYRLYPLNRTRGCIAWDSIVAGDGWVGYLTRDGYVVTDGEREVVISRDLWDAGTLRGSLSYEIGESVKAVGKDDDSSHFHAAVLGHALHISYRSSAGASIPDFRQVYDFSQGADASGLAEVLRPTPEGLVPYGWSPPCLNAFGPMVRIDGPTGLEYYGAIESNNGSTGDGEINQFETGNYDVPRRGTVAVNAFSNGVTTLTASTVGGFNGIPVGALLTGTGIQASGVTVVSKASNGNTVTVTPAIVGGGGATILTSYGIEIQPLAFMASDLVEELKRRKSIQTVSVLYKHPGATMVVGIARDPNRTNTQEIALSVTSGDNDRAVIEAPQVSRTPAKWVEMYTRVQGISTLGATPNPHEFWGLEAELELLESFI